MTTVLQQRPMTALEWVLLVTLALLWGGVFFSIKVAVAEIPPFTLVLLRVSIAAVALGALLVLTRQSLPRSGSLWLGFLGMGLINNALPFSLQAWAQTHIAGGLAAILNATTPLFTVLVAHWLTRDERITKNRLLGVLLGLSGVTLLIGVDALANLGVDLLPQLAILGGALSYAFAGILGRRIKNVPPLVFAFGTLCGCTVWTLPLSLAIDQPWTLAMPRAEVWWSVLFLAIAGTACGFIIYFRLLATAGATNLMLVTLLVPPTALTLGAIFLHERLGLQHFGGLGIIALGLIAIDGRLLQRLKRS